MISPFSNFVDLTYHSGVDISPFQSCYGESDNAEDLHIFDCRILVPDHDTKKSADRAKVRRFMAMPKVEHYFNGLMLTLTMSSTLTAPDFSNWIQQEKLALLASVYYN
jgi:hypothetical protein